VGGSRSGKKEVTVVAAAAVVLMLITTISLHLPTYSVTLSLPDYTCLLFALNIHSLLFLSFLSFYPSLFTSFFFRVKYSSLGRMFTWSFSSCHSVKRGAA